MLNTFFDKYIFTNGLRYTHYNFFLMNVPFAVVPVDVLVGLAKIEDLEANRQVYAALKMRFPSRGCTSTWTNFENRKRGLMKNFIRARSQKATRVS